MDSRFFDNSAFKGVLLEHFLNHRYLLTHAFRAQGPLYRVTLEHFFREYFRLYRVQVLASDDQRSREIMERALDTAFDLEKWPNGAGGISNLEPVEQALLNGEMTQISLGLARTHFAVARFGHCLSLYPRDEQGNPHTAALKILESMVQGEHSPVVPFVDQYSILVPPVIDWKSGGASIEVRREVKTATTRGIEWSDHGPDFTEALTRDFIERRPNTVDIYPPPGLIVGRLGDATVSLRLVWFPPTQFESCIKHGQVFVAADQNTRRGMILGTTPSGILVDTNAARELRFEYVVRVLPDDPVENLDHEIDYAEAYRLLQAVTRKLWLSLSERAYDQVTKANLHWINVKPKATA